MKFKRGKFFMTFPWGGRASSAFVLLLCVLVGWQGVFLNGLGWADDTGKPKGVPFVGFRLHPEIQTTTRWEDNIYKTEINAQSDQIVLIKPGVKLAKNLKRSNLTLAAMMEAEYYNNNRIEDNFGYQFKLDYGLKPNRKLKIDTGYEYLVEHEERGTPGSGPIPTSLGPNQWRQHVWKLTNDYTLNRLNTKLDLKHFDRESGNNNQSMQNRHWNDVGLTVKWAFFPKTGLLLETGWQGIKYDVQPLMDSQELRLLVGATWKVTKKTSGTFKVGKTVKQYDAGVTPTAKGLSWDSDIEWLPIKRTRVNLSTGRQFQEGETGAYIMTKYKLQLEHHLLPRFSVQAGFSLDNSDFGNNRQEDYWKTQVGIKYEFPRWFVLESGYARTIKETDQIGANYQSNGVFITLSAAM